MGEVLLETGNEAGGLTHLVAARAGYRTWGALAKIRDLESRYPQIAV